MGEPSGARMRSVPGGALRALAASEFVSDQEATASALEDDWALDAALSAPAAERSTTPRAAAPDIPGLLALLPALEDEIEAGERRLRECVRLLRAHRATWREIGDALQVSRQAAWERFRTS